MCAKKNDYRKNLLSASVIANCMGNTCQQGGFNRGGVKDSCIAVFDALVRWRSIERPPSDCRLKLNRNAQIRVAVGCTPTMVAPELRFHDQSGVRL